MRPHLRACHWKCPLPLQETSQVLLRVELYELVVAGGWIEDRKIILIHAVKGQSVRRRVPALL